MVPFLFRIRAINKIFVMGYLKFPKLYLNKGLLFSAVFAFLFDGISAKSVRTLSLEPNGGNMVQDVVYAYQLFYDDLNRLNCLGTLNLSVSLPADVQTFIVERTNHNDLDSDNLRFTIKSGYPSTANVSISNVYWGTYFRVCAVSADGSREYTPIYAINDYIDNEDLESLMQLSSVESVDDGSIDLVVKDKELRVEVPNSVSLVVSDLNGKQLFAGNVHKSRTIPLDGISHPFIIVTYISSNIKTTKKYLIQ